MIQVKYSYEDCKTYLSKLVQKFTLFMRTMRIPLLLAFLHFFVTTAFQFDKLFFVYENDTLCYYSIKLFYFISLTVAWCFPWYVYQQCKNGNERFKHGVFIFAFYLSIMSFFMLILWPGTWAWDDVFMVNEIRSYSIRPWQHSITSIIQMIFLNFIPCPGGIVIIQNVIVALCVAFSVTELESGLLGNFRLKYKLLDSLIKILPFLLPGVLTYQFSGYRFGLYVYLVLVFMVILVSARYKMSWSFLRVIIYSITASLIAEWRTEGIFFLPVSCIFLLLQKRALCSIRKKLFGIFCILCLFFTLDFVQKKKLGNSNYEIVSTLRPLCELVRHSDEKDAKELEALERVIFVQTILDSNKNGEELYWEGKTVKPNYTKKDYAAYLKAFFVLSIRHPKVVANERLMLFINTSNFKGKTAVTNVNSTRGLNDFHKSSNNGIQSFGNYAHNRPVFNKLRIKLLNAWEWKPLYRILWNPVIPMTFLFIAFVYFGFCRNWYLFFLLLSEAVKVLLSFLTAPAHWFMYYLPEYLLGWTFFLYLILYFTAKKYNRNLNKCL